MTLLNNDLVDMVTFLFLSLFLGCIAKKYSAKVLAKCWADIHKSVNQKCMRKKKTTD